jgi:putative tricarboxylic transport membrane protein
MDVARQLSPRLRDALIGLACVSVGAAALALVPSQVPGETLAAVGEPTSPAFFPILAAGVLALLGIALAAQAFMSDPQASAEGERILTADYLAMSAALALYVMLIPVIGMYLSSALMIVGLSLLFRYRRLSLVLASALLTPALVWLLFEKGLIILFPRGAFF